MSYTTSERANRRAGHILGTLFFDLWEQHRRDAAQRRAIHNLSALDDHLLRDIGVSRASIRDRVRGRR